ncbi:MAG TPA: T9SS type A sorting domain-containing protein [Bacteroidia bacterium]|nr:T9SS type A sorting domain-containing protein [Bacteroidia bacterium]
MKNNFCIISILFCLPVFAQNGVTTIPMPTGYTSNQLAAKNAIAVDNASHEFVGFRQIGLGKYDGVSWTMYDTTNSAMPSNDVRAVYCDGGNVWIGTDKGAASFIGNTWTIYNVANSGIGSDTVYGITRSGNTFWFATRNGLSEFDGANWNNYTPSNSGLVNKVVNSVAVETGGNVWAATAGGISMKNGNSWTSYTTSNSPIGSNNSQVCIDNNGERWFSAGGIFMFNGASFVSASSMEPSPLLNNATYLCGEGPHGNVLIRALSMYYEHSFPSNSYYFSQFGAYPKSAWQSNGNKMWFIFTVGGSTALYEFDPTQYNGFGLGLNPNDLKVLDVNEVSAPILNRGDMHWDLNSAGYEVPKGSGTHPIFASAIWLGGLDAGGNLHQAAMTYRQLGSDFWPGPLDTTNGTSDSVVANQFDYIWKIDKWQIQNFQYYWSTGAVQSGAYIPEHDILTWPGNGTGNQMHYLAPFIDVNGNGIYDPLTGGDYPDIKGDEELYWIFNDHLAHTETGGQEMNVEIHATAYAFACPTIADSEKVLNYTTYYDFKMYNWSGQPYHNDYFGVWEDMDLGDYTDDYVGCIPSANIGFTYNGDANDGASALPTLGTYGAHPPVCSVVMLDGPPAVSGDLIDNDNDGTIDEAGEHNLMSGFIYYNNDFSVTGNPENGPDYYGYLNEQWKDSTLITIGGNGYGGITPTRFMYPALPYDNSGWNEPTAGNTPFDRRFLISCGPFNLDPGIPESVDYAIMYTRDTTMAPRDTALWDLVLHNAGQLRQWYSTNSEPSCLAWNVGINEPQPDLPPLKLYPNPASTLLTIDYKPVSDKATYQVLDMTGREILSGSVNSYGETAIGVEELSSGIYAVRIVDDGRSSAVKFIRE